MPCQADPVLILFACLQVSLWMGEGALKAQLQHIDPMLSEQLYMLVSGQPLDGTTGTAGMPIGGASASNDGASMLPELAPTGPT